MRVTKVPLYFNIFLFLLYMVVARATAVFAVRQRYIVVHPNSVHPFDDHINRAAANLDLLMRANKQSFVAADLTKKEVRYLRNIVAKNNGLIVANNLLFLDDTVIVQDQKLAAISAVQPDEFLSAPPRCAAPLDNVDFVVLDTLIFKNVTEFSNVNITYGPIFSSNQQPCHPHATQVASIIAGNTLGVVPNGNRTIYNIAVFNCAGEGYPEQIIRGFNAAIEYAKLNLRKGRRTVVNFSGIGGINLAINLAATAVGDSGIPLFIPAGNSGVNACKIRSPAMAKRVFTVGATQASGNIPANFTNFGDPCVKLFLPGENISVVNYANNGTVKVDGTSFSVPIAAALGGIELGQNPHATPALVFQQLIDKTRTKNVIPPAYAHFHGPMRVMLAADACPSNQTAQRVILVYPDNIHPFKILPDPDTANVTILMHTQNTVWTAATLTQPEINNLQEIIVVAGGVIAENNVIILEDTQYFPASNVAASGSDFLTDTPYCNATLNGVDFVVIDTVAFTNITEFQNANIKLGPRFDVDAQPCHPHASEVISTIVGNTTGVIPYGDRGVINIGVFNCLGQAFPEQIIQGINAGLEVATANARIGRRTILNFSGVGAKNAAINSAATAIAKADIPFFVAAGNNGVNACDSQSPVSAKGIFAVGSTTPPGNIPADFTNFGSKCVPLFLPGDQITVVDVINGGTIKVSGTSFSSPIAAALGGLEYGLAPAVTTNQMFSRITSQPRTILVNPPLGSNFFTPMPVMLTANACPLNTRIFNQVKANKKTSNKFKQWYNATLDQNFCASFSAKSTKGPLLIGLRNNQTDNDITQIKIGDNKGLQGKFANTIKQGGITLNATNTDKNILAHHAANIFVVQHQGDQLSVAAASPFGVTTPIIFSKLTNSPTQIAVSSIGGGVTYFNAIRCTM